MGQTPEGTPPATTPPATTPNARDDDGNTHTATDSEPSQTATTEATAGADTPPSAPSTQGTAAPAPASAPTGPAPTAAAREDEEDEGSEIFYLRAGGGYTFANLVAFKQENFLPGTEEVKGSGYMGEFASGFRLGFVTLGAQAVLARFDSFDLGHVGPQLGLRLPTPFIEPVVQVAVGYGWVGTANFSDAAASETSVFGLVADVTAGVDLELASWLQLGAHAGVTFLNLTRQDVNTACALDACAIDEVNLTEDGDSVGLQARGEVHLRLSL